MENLFPIGSVVSILTGLLLHDQRDLLNDLKYNGRDQVYGVIMETNPDYEYIISWSMTRLHGISDEAEDIYNTASYMERDLCLVVTNRQDNFDNDALLSDTYLTHFFRYHKVDHKWEIYGWNEDCVYCRGIPQGYDGCHRENSYILSSMSHLYFDLEHSSNADMSNDTKIDVCINHYKRVRNVPLHARLDICVKLEIKRFFGKSSNNTNGAL